jgi:biofilm protein TabA
MIVGHLEDLRFYENLHPNLKDAIDYLKQHDLMSLPQGKTEIKGSDVFILRETYQARPLFKCFFEGHLKYLDLQIVLKGVEYFGYYPKGEQGIKVTDPYQIEKDIEKYQIDDFTKVILSEGMFAIVFPEDLHMPKLEKERHTTVEKAVFKIKL